MLYCDAEVYVSVLDVRRGGATRGQTHLKTNTHAELNTKGKLLTAKVESRSQSC